MLCKHFVLKTMEREKSLYTSEEIVQIWQGKTVNFSMDLDHAL